MQRNPSNLYAALMTLLRDQGPLTSIQLQQFLQRSQPVISRLIARAGDEIRRLGRARSTRYAIGQSIRGLPSLQPLYWVDGQGSARRFGSLQLLARGMIHVQTDIFESTTAGLPWYLAPWKLEGFLGRLEARRLAPQGLGSDPDHWTTEDVLYAAIQGHDHPGAIELGDLILDRPAPPYLPAAGTPLAAALDRLAEDVARTLPAGSSAGGEQPKFLGRQSSLDTAAEANAGRHVLVKFSPPLGTPYGDRWRDLLQAEMIANTVLDAHGLQSARVQFFLSSRRAYLISDRFDRLNTGGRRHAVSIGAVHRGLLSERYTQWADTARTLASIGRVTTADAVRIQLLLHFGRLIGNTDMHAGNLSFWVEPEQIVRGPLALAPVYDMLPMCWKPEPALAGSDDYLPFSLDERALGGPARALAQDYWARIAACDALSGPLRKVARTMLDRCSRR